MLRPEMEVKSLKLNGCCATRSQSASQPVGRKRKKMGENMRVLLPRDRLAAAGASESAPAARQSGDSVGPTRRVGTKVRKRRRKKPLGLDQNQDPAVDQMSLSPRAAPQTRSQQANRRRPIKSRPSNPNPHSSTTQRRRYLAHLIVVHSISLLLLASRPASSLAETNSPQAASVKPPTSSQTTSQLGPAEGHRTTTTSLSETEQEVDLLNRPPEVSLISQQQQHSRAPARARGPRIYRIRATQQMNGRLDGPIRIVAAEQRAASALADADQLEADRPPANSEPQFGARWSPATNLRVKQVNGSQLFDLSAAASASGHTKLHSRQQPLQQFPCNQSAADELTASNANELAERSNSIAATSQTLRLFAPSQQRAQHVLKSPGRQQPGEIDESESSPNARPALSMAAANSSTAGQQGESQSPGEPISLAPNSVEPVDFDSTIITNRTKAALSCDSGEMIVRLNFSEPFKGMVYPDHNRMSPCRFFGDGHHNYELRLPLRGCGTRQVAPRIFVNDVIVRFHKSLELEEDEVKTLICRYPPPASSATANNYDGAAGQLKGLVQELDGNPNQNQRARQKHQQQPPFELLEPIVRDGFRGRSPSSRIISSSPGTIPGSVEILSSQLAPPLYGNTNQHSPYDLSPNGSGGPRVDQQETLTSLFGPKRTNEQLLNSRQKNANIVLSDPPNNANGNNNDAILFAGSGSIQQVGDSSRATTFLDRLTSVELLFLISSLMFLVLLAFGLVGTYYCLHRHRHRSASSAGAILRRKRRYLGGSGAGSHYTTHSSLHATPLSPDSIQQHFPDTSAHILHRPPHHHHYPRQQQPLHRNSKIHQHQQQQRLHFNAPSSSSPESNISQHQVLIPMDKSSSQLVAGQRVPSTVSSIKANGNLYRPTYEQYDQPTMNLPHHQLRRAGIASSMRKEPPVLGRREAVYMSNGHALGRAVGPMASGNCARDQQRISSTLGRRQRANRQQASAQPLLQIARQTGSVTDLFGRDEYALNRAKSVLQLHQPTKIYPASGTVLEAQPRNLSAEMSNSWRILSETGSTRQDDELVGHSSVQRNRKKPTGPTLAETSNNQADPFDVSTSESEAELNVSDSKEHEKQTTGHRLSQSDKPKIYLKSIEDRFITNFTEIREQEYLHRDSRAPLSLVQWKAMQSNPISAHKTNYEAPTHSVHATAGNLELFCDSDKTSQQSSEAVRQHDETNEEEAGEDDNPYHSSKANLRSLTELDVNFARSSRIVQKLSPDGEILPSSAPKQQQTLGERPSHQTDSPDLVISPDYEISRGERPQPEDRNIHTILSPSTDSVSCV